MLFGTICVELRHLRTTCSLNFKMIFLMNYRSAPHHLSFRSESNGVEAVNKLLEENSSWKGRVESLVLDVSKKVSILEAVTKLSLSKGKPSHLLR